MMGQVIHNSSSSGEIKDDSGDERDLVPTIQPEAIENGHFNCQKLDSEEEICLDQEDHSQLHFDVESDYRQPRLSPEQICLRVRKIPTPNVLAELNDVGLRRLLCDIYELDREQVRFANNRRKLLEQMRQMHSHEMSLLRECMEALKKLMSERGMNLLSTHIGQDVMEFLREKNQDIDADNVTSSARPSVSSESCSNSVSVFPKTQSFAHGSVPPKPHLFPEKCSVFGYPSLTPTISGQLTIPPPNFSVPPPFPGPFLQAWNEKKFGGSSASKFSTRDVPATSSVSAPSLITPVTEGEPQPLRSISMTSSSERIMETASGSKNHIVSNGSVQPLEVRTSRGREVDHSQNSSLIPPQPPMLSMMRPQFNIPSFRDVIPAMDNSCGGAFSDERGPVYSNSRIVSLYDDGRLPFHEYEHPQGNEAIRIRHVWSTRPPINQRRTLLQGIIHDRRIQRLGAAAACPTRIYETESRDRSRSPLGRSKSVIANFDETGFTNAIASSCATQSPSNITLDDDVILINEGQESGIKN